MLDNVTQDASGVHESVAMAFYARLGIPAPREVHTRLYVNNEYAGLYVIVESVDKDMLARVFGAIGDDTQNDGYLYEFKWMDDWKFGYLGDSLDRIQAALRTHDARIEERRRAVPADRDARASGQPARRPIDSPRTWRRNSTFPR